MFFTYGSYRHPDNEVKLLSYLSRSLYSPRGKRWMRVVEMHIQIEVVLDIGTIYTTATAQAFLKDRINEIITAYDQNYADATFYHDDGTPTPHKLTNANSISGVCVSHRSWPKGDPPEYATTRTAYLKLYAEYLDIDSEIWSWEERCINIGNGAPRWEMQELVVGYPTPVYLTQRTRQRVIQIGSAVGIEGYPLAYITPLWPQFEHGDRRRIEPGSPTARGQGYTHYPISWTIEQTLAVPQNNFPNLR